MHTIKILNGEEFIGDHTSTIFQSAQKYGIQLEHSCLAARCKSCKIKLLSGQTHNVHDELVLSEEEKKQGIILSCNSTPASDLVIEAEDLSAWNLPKSRTLPSKIDSIEYLNENIARITLRLPSKSSFNFVPGQYVNLIKGSIKRSYSIANCNQEDEKLHFFIKNYPNGVFSKYWFENARVNDLIRLEGPLGTFFLRNSNKKEIVFLATGTGIAPVKAIVEQLISRGIEKFNQKITIFWGARKSADFFWKPNFIIKKINFIPVLSRPEENWEGQFGYVQDILIKMFSNVLDDIEVYACGSNDMINESHSKLRELGLSEKHYFSDAFVSSN